MKLVNPQMIGLIYLSLFSNMLIAQNNTPSSFNGEETIAFNSAMNTNHYSGTNVRYMDHNDTVNYLVVVDATDHLSNKNNPDLTKTNNLTTAENNSTYMEASLSIYSLLKNRDILFDYRDWHLTRNSKEILDAVALVLIQNPEMIIELGAHADSRGLYAENMVLSQKRVDQAVDYLITKGVNKKQMIGIAYGETSLKNVCDSDSRCSEDVHAGNRRLEIVVISTGK